MRRDELCNFIESTLNEKSKAIFMFVDVSFGMENNSKKLYSSQPTPETYV
jgi:hypothetical protein